LDAVVSVAGGFLMGSIKNETIFAETERMLAFNLKSAIAASFVAANCLKEGGLLVLTGADSALKPTPTMIAYGKQSITTYFSRKVSAKLQPIISSIHWLFQTVVCLKILL
jgi:hypothetical protein